MALESDEAGPSRPPRRRSAAQNGAAAQPATSKRDADSDNDSSSGNDEDVSDSDYVATDDEANRGEKAAQTRQAGGGVKRAPRARAQAPTKRQKKESAAPLPNGDGDVEMQGGMGAAPTAAPSKGRHMFDCVEALHEAYNQVCLIWYPPPILADV